MYKSEKGSEFIGIRNYLSSKGEISNQRLNIGVSVLNAKEKDLETLKGLSIDSLYVIANGLKIDHSIADEALFEMLISSTKNVSKELENRTAQSQGQTNAYTHINKGMKILTESGALYVSGFVTAKTVLVKGEYKTVNKQDKTKIKDAVKKHLDFKMNHFRSFIFKNADNYKINGNEIIVK